jgi:hypothetical protein
MARTEKGEPEKTGFPILTELMPDRLPKVAGIDNAKFKVFEDFRANIQKVLDAQRQNTPADRMPLVLADKTVVGAQELPRDVELLEPNGGTVKVPVHLVSQETYDAIVEKAKKEGREPPPLLRTTLQADLDTLRKQQAAGRPVEPKLEENLTKLMDWWNTYGQSNFSDDEKQLIPARLHGAKTALLYTAVVPLALAVGFMLLILYFFATGGYKQVHLEEAPRGPAPVRPGAPHEAWGR